MNQKYLPIMPNRLEDLNQIVAICTLFKALGANKNDGCALHINIGADYLECREKAIENILTIWKETEELFFKISNEEGELIRSESSLYSVAIKQNIQTTFEEDGSITLNTEEDLTRFIFNIQAKNRMDEILGWEHADLYLELDNEESTERIYEIYKKYLKEKDDEDFKIK